jgi:type IV pilus assembly protein PilW
MNFVHGHGSGFTLLELSIALLATSVIALGTISLAQAVTTSSRLQQSLSALDENARFAVQSIGAEVRQAGYRSRPWAKPGSSAFEGSANNVSSAGDRLVVRRWSDRNCYDNENAILDDHGRPAFHIRISTFEVSASGQLAVSCEYGPDENSLVRQLNRLGLVERVLSFQTQFALDADADGNAESWSVHIPADEASRVLGVRVGVLLQSKGLYGEQPEKTFALLDETGIRVSGSRLYSAVEAAWPVMGELQS